MWEEEPLEPPTASADSTPPTCSTHAPRRVSARRAIWLARTETLARARFRRAQLWPLQPPVRSACSAARLVAAPLLCLTAARRRPVLPAKSSACPTAAACLTGRPARTSTSAALPTRSDAATDRAARVRTDAPLRSLAQLDGSSARTGSAPPVCPAASRPPSVPPRRCAAPAASAQTIACCARRSRPVQPSRRCCAPTGRAPCRWTTA